MNMVRTLCDLSDLRDSRFGQPPPRHGLRLLWWFTRECVCFDNNGRLIALCNPAEEDCGFRPFYNIDRLLPFITNFPYYKTGNLKYCDSLPHYVTKNCKQFSADCNKDRIIVSIHSGLNDQVWFEDIYVTEHSDEAHFDQNRTYRISRNLLEAIRNLNLADFLRQMEANQQYNQQINYNQQPSQSSNQSRQWSYPSNATHQSSDEEVCKRCCICVLLLLLLFLVFVVVL